MLPAVPMTKPDDSLACRPCLLSPLREHEVAAELLTAAANAIEKGQTSLAVAYLREADIPELREYSNKLLRSVDPMILRRRPGGDQPKQARPKARMPAAAVRRQVHERDGWRCRFCGCKVVAK